MVSIAVSIPVIMHRVTSREGRKPMDVSVLSLQSD